MTELIIRYKDGEGNVTERRISDFVPVGPETVFAFCHLRQEKRSFRIPSIVYAAYPETGEVIENLYKFFGMSLAEDGRERLCSITTPILPAIKALKSFSMQIRGTAMRKRERTHIVRFIQQNADVSNYSEEEIDNWFHKLWCGDVYKYYDGDTSEYLDLLRQIPHQLMNKCRQVALAIAKGSGRKPISPEINRRINEEFTT